MGDARDKKFNVLFFLGGLIVITMLGIVGTLFVGGVGEAIGMQLIAAYVTVYYAGSRVWFHLYFDTEL